MFRFYFCVISLLLSVSLLLCGCKSPDDVVSDYSSIPTVYSSVPTVENVSSDVSSQTNAPPTHLDPVIEREQSGVSVNISEVAKVEAHQNGIDVSKWQGKIDWKKVKNSGIDFAIIRIGYRAENGNIYKDSFADYNLQQAEKHSIITGVYFFSTAINQAEALEEAKWVETAIAGYPISLVAWDCEGFKKLDSRMFGMTAAARTDNACTFFNYIKKSGYDPVCYAAVNDLNDFFFDVDRLENSAKIWVAHYPDTPYPKTSAPSYSGKYHLWQYTDRGTVSGVNGNCDLVVSYYEIKAQKAKNSSLRPNDTKAPTTEKSEYKTVNETVTAKDYVNLRVEASTTAKVLGQLKNGETLQRTGIGSNGWSKLNFGGKTVYAISSYLTTDLTVKAPSSSEPSDGFIEKSGKLTAKEETNLRSSPSTNSAIVYTLKNGEFITLVAENPQTGWSRLLYNEKTVYAKTQLLTDKVSPVSSETPPSSEPTSSAPKGQTYKEVNEQVTAKSETNLRDKASTEGSTVVYTLKNGEFITRTGIGDKGWSRLIYNGQTVYAVTSYLTTENKTDNSSQ